MDKKDKVKKSGKMDKKDKVKENAHDQNSNITPETQEESPQKRIERLNNTFLLALDGDVDFHPSALQLLIDRMKRNENVGAACGRIHPIGAGCVFAFCGQLMFDVK